MDALRCSGRHAGAGVGGDHRIDRAILLSALADASSSRAGLGYEVVVTRLDDEANIAPWLRAANRYGAKVKWTEVDIETGELPTWQWESLITKPTRLVAVTSASSTLGTVCERSSSSCTTWVDWWWSITRRPHHTGSSTRSARSP
jgi:hypothetical protein